MHPCFSSFSAVIRVTICTDFHNLIRWLGMWLCLLIVNAVLLKSARLWLFESPDMCQTEAGTNVILFFFLDILFCVSPGPHPQSHANLNPFWIHHHNIPDLYKSLLVEGLACDCAELSCEDTAAQSSLNLSALSKLKQKRWLCISRLPGTTVFLSEALAYLLEWLMSAEQFQPCKTLHKTIYTYPGRQTLHLALLTVCVYMCVHVCICEA